MFRDLYKGGHDRTIIEQTMIAAGLDPSVVLPPSPIGQEMRKLGSQKNLRKNSRMSDAPVENIRRKKKKERKVSFNDSHVKPPPLQRYNSGRGDSLVNGRRAYGSNRNLSFADGRERGTSFNEMTITETHPLEDSYRHSHANTNTNYRSVSISETIQSGQKVKKKVLPPSYPNPSRLRRQKTTETLLTTGPTRTNSRTNIRTPSIVSNNSTKSKARGFIRREKSTKSIFETHGQSTHTVGVPQLQSYRSNKMLRRQPSVVEVEKPLTYSLRESNIDEQSSQGGGGVVSTRTYIRRPQNQDKQRLTNLTVETQASKRTFLRKERPLPPSRGIPPKNNIDFAVDQRKNKVHNNRTKTLSSDAKTSGRENKSTVVSNMQNKKDSIENTSTVTRPLSDKPVIRATLAANTPLVAQNSKHGKRLQLYPYDSDVYKPFKAMQIAGKEGCDIVVALEEAGLDPTVMYQNVNVNRHPNEPIKVDNIAQQWDLKFSKRYFDHYYENRKTGETLWKEEVDKLIEEQQNLENQTNPPTIQHTMQGGPNITDDDI